MVEIFVGLVLCLILAHTISVDIDRAKKEILDDIRKQRKENSDERRLLERNHTSTLCDISNARDRIIDEIKKNKQ